MGNTKKTKTCKKTKEAYYFILKDKKHVIHPLIKKKI
jgi:hypothetical protein